MDPRDYRQQRCPHGWVNATQCRACALKAENDALRKDAERYRWLRANFTQLVVVTQGGDAPRMVDAVVVNENMAAPDVASVDVAIDTAMAAAPTVGAAGARR